jgi:hypothetical protein
MARRSYYRRRRRYRRRPRRYRRRYARRRYGRTRLPVTMLTKLWNVRENTAAHVLTANTHFNYVIPMNHLVIYPIAHQSGPYSLPTNFFGQQISYKAATLAGTFNKYIVMGARIRVKVVNVSPSNSVPLRVWYTFCGVGGGSNQGTGFEDTASYLISLGENVLSGLQGVKHKDCQHPASGRNVIRFSKYISTRRALHIGTPKDEEHLKCGYPEVDPGTGDIVGGTAPKSDFTYGLYIRVTNRSAAASAEFFIRVSITWYVYLFDRVRNLRDIINSPPALLQVETTHDIKPEEATQE